MVLSSLILGENWEETIMKKKVNYMLSKLVIGVMLVNLALSPMQTFTDLAYAETKISNAQSDTSSTEQENSRKNELSLTASTSSMVTDEKSTSSSINNRVESGTQPADTLSKNEQEYESKSEVSVTSDTITVDRTEVVEQPKGKVADTESSNQQITGGLHVSNKDFYWDGKMLLDPTESRSANVRYTLTLDETARKTGTVDFDTDNEAGHDADGSNAVIRTNDVLEYPVKISIARIDGGTEQFSNLPTLYAVPVFQDDTRVGSKNYQPTGTFKNSTYKNDRGNITFAKVNGDQVSGSIYTLNVNDYSTTTTTGTAVTRNIKINVGVLPNDFNFAIGIILADRSYLPAASSTTYGLANDLEPIKISQKSTAYVSGLSAANSTNPDSWTKDDEVGPKNVTYKFGVSFGAGLSKGGGSLGFKINNMVVNHTGTYAFENQAKQDIPMDPKSSSERYKGYTGADPGNVSIQYQSSGGGSTQPVGKALDFTTSNDDWLANSTWIPTDGNAGLANLNVNSAVITYVFNDLNPYDIGGELNPDNFRSTTTRSLTLSAVKATDFFDEPIMVEKQPTVTTSWTSNTPGIIDGSLQITKSDADTMTLDKNIDNNGRNNLAYSSSSQIVRVGFLYGPENYKDGMTVEDGILKDTVLWGAFNHSSYTLNEKDTARNFYTKDADGNITGTAQGTYEYGVPKDPQQKITDEFLHQATQDDFIWKYKDNPAGANNDPQVAAFRVTLPKTVYVQFKKYNGEINRWGASPHIHPLLLTPKFIGNSDKDGITNLVVAHAITSFDGGESTDYLRPDSSDSKQYTSFNAVKNKNPETWIGTTRQTPSNYWIDYLAYGVSALNVSVTASAEKPSVALGDPDRFNYSMKLSTEYLEGFKYLSKEDLKNQLAKTKIELSIAPDDKGEGYTYIDNDGETHKIAVFTNEAGTLKTVDFNDPKNEGLLNYLTDAMYQNFVTENIGNVTLNFSGEEFMTTQKLNNTRIDASVNFFGNWVNDSARALVTSTTPNGLGVLEKISPKTVGKLGSKYQIQVYPFVFNIGNEVNLRGIIPLPVSGQDGSDFSGASILTNITVVNSNKKTVTFYYSKKQNLNISPSEPIEEGTNQEWIKWDGKPDSLKDAKSIAYQIDGSMNNEMLQFNLDLQTDDNQSWDRYRQRSYINSDSKYRELIPSNYVQYVVFENGNVEITKVDGTTKDPLDGAEFVMTSDKNALSDIQHRLDQYHKDILSFPAQAVELKAALLKDLAPYLVRGNLAELLPELNGEVVNSDNLDRMWRYLSSDYRLEGTDKLDFNKDGIVNEADKALFMEGAIAPYVVTTSKGEATFNNLEVGDGGSSKDYWVFEINSPNQYVNNSKPIPVVVEKNGTAKVEVENEKYSFDVQKEWKDVPEGITPPEITVDLYANGQKTYKSIQLNETNGYHGSFSDLDVRDSEGNVIHYTVKEQVPNQYSADKKQGEIVENLAKLTNTYISEKISIDGIKTWKDNDNQDKKRPDEITVNLLANGEVIQSKKVTAEDSWVYKFTELDKYRAGKLINYTVTEDPVEGYTPTIDGTAITNEYTPEETKIEGTKTWDDHNNQDGIRPGSITVHLMDGDKEVDSKEVKADADGKWKYKFDKLPVYKDGKQILYTVKEDSVKDYTETVSGYNIINSHVPETIKIEGAKTWKDNNDAFSIRPKQITIMLLADGKELKTTTVTANDDWKYSFDHLPKYRDEGKKIKYTIKEEKVIGYQSENVGNNLVNTLITVDVKGNKIWDDQNNKAKIRPTSIKVALMQNGKLVATGVVKATDDWKYKFPDLAKVDKNGKEYKYTVKELDVPQNYSSSVKKYVITNTYKPEVPPQNPKKPRNDNPKHEKPSKQQKSFPKTGFIENHWLSVVGSIIVFLVVLGYTIDKHRKKS